MKKRLSSLLIFLWTVSGVLAQEIPAPPNPPRLLNDFAQQLNVGERAELERKLVAYNDSTSNQILVVIVPTTGPYEIADYAFKLGREWGVGQKDKNNGLVILWAPKDRKVYIATGYGLEGAIPDAIAKRIVSDVIIPEFKNDRYFQGLNRGVDEIMKYASGEYKAEPRDRDDGSPSGALVFIIVFVIIIIIISRSKGGGGGRGGRGFRGGVGPVIFPYDTYSGWGRSSGNWGGGSSGGGGFGGFGGGSFGGGGAGGNY
ncbi:hypothetical protein GCM10027275_04520 [Rhabdobacter roseus]|uniref:TPM domain-containing protein n=1 Tax=Rhabdobacter roseus TaxID=1655419 RepID=A0A840TM81_9BACT|nr:TPM domain-containing protein [Rhabdobacter roseus]MBB5282343.1 uncharacterized protein [Rhabdobacter roseus]